MVQRNPTIRTIKCIGFARKLCMLVRTIFNRKISIEYGGISIRLKAGILVYVYVFCKDIISIKYSILS